MKGLCPLDPAIGGVFHGDLVTGSGQERIDDLGNLGFVVDHENSGVFSQHRKCLVCYTPLTVIVGLLRPNLRGIRERASISGIPLLALPTRLSAPDLVVGPRIRRR